MDLLFDLWLISLVSAPRTACCSFLIICRREGGGFSGFVHGTLKNAHCCVRRQLLMPTLLPFSFRYDRTSGVLLVSFNLHA